MILSQDGVWTISKSHNRILEIIEELELNNKHTNMETIKIKSKVQNTNGYLQDLLKLKFIKYDCPQYKLTISGYDCIAINKLRNTGLQKLHTKIGVGKESDIFSGIYNNQNVALKFHRLGRTSFRTIKNNRDYAKGKIDWYKINKISCVREVKYYELFKDFDIPKYIAHNRHILVMELLDYQLLHMTKLDNPSVVYKKLIDFVKQLWSFGYVHGDLNEFNVMVSDTDIKVIDFPQCIKKSNEKAVDYLVRDIECIQKYFYKKYDLVCDSDILQECV